MNFFEIEVLNKGSKMYLSCATSHGTLVLEFLLFTRKGEQEEERNEERKSPNSHMEYDPK